MTDTYVHDIAGSSGGGGGSGTVTSVGLADSSNTPIYSISGSPVTTSGTLIFSLINESANTIFSGPTTGSAAQPTFRTMVAADIPNALITYSKIQNEAASTLLGNPTGSTASVSAITLGTGLSFSGTVLNSAGGTVTSVALADTSTTPIYNISGSPITGSGTLDITLANQSAHAFLSGPASGAATQPTFRAIAVADVPTLNQNTTGSAATFTGSLVGDITGTQGATALTATTNSTLTTLGSLSLPVGQLSGTVALSQGGTGSTSLTGITGTGEIVASASPTLTGTALASNLTLSGTLTSSNLTATAGAGVQLTITGGTAASTGAGGAVNISGAAASGGSANSGGAATLSAGASVNANGVNTSIVGGAGGPGSSSGFNGGNAVMTAGAGGAAITTGGNGGNSIYNAGTGGSAGTPGTGGYHSFLTAVTTSLSETMRVSSGLINVTSAQIQINTAGFGLTIKSGSNAKIGSSTLSSGTIVVSNTSVTANSAIFLDVVGISSGRVQVSSRTAGTGFTLLSTNLSDTNVVNWNIVEKS